MPSLLINQGTNAAVMFEDQGGTAFRQSVAVNNGTVNLVSSVGSVLGIRDKIYIATMDGGTINTGTINTGTINAGTINTGTVDLVKAGTITRLEGGTLGVVTTVSNVDGGTIVVTQATSSNLKAQVQGLTAAGVLNSSNPFVFAGTDTGGSIRIPIVGETSKALLTEINTGTIANSGTTTGVGVVTTVTNLSNGTIRVTAGTINTGTINAGTVNTGTINAGTINVATIAAGSVVMTVGTIAAGTINDQYGAIGTMTITLAALASSTSGVGRQSTIIDNTTTKYRSAIIGVRTTVGSVTTANNMIGFYLIRGDNGGGPIQDDRTGASDAAGTVINAPLLGNILVPSVGTAVEYQAVFDTSPLGALGPKWGILVSHNLGNNLHNTAGSHSVTWTGITQSL